MARPRLTAEQRQRVTALLRQGVSVGRVSEILLIKRPIVRYYAKAQREPRTADAVVYGPVREWMLAEHISFDAIARRAGYSKTAVWKQLCGESVVNKDIIDTVMMMAGKGYTELFQ